jgi:hypothetical protein
MNRLKINSNKYEMGFIEFLQRISPLKIFFFSLNFLNSDRKLPEAFIVSFNCLRKYLFLDEILFLNEYFWTKLCRCDFINGENFNGQTH